MKESKQNMTGKEEGRKICNNKPKITSIHKIPKNCMTVAYIKIRE